MRARLGFLYGSMLLAGGCSIPCKKHDDEPRPKLRSHEEFCRDWAASACSEEAVGNCQASSAATCRARQVEFCRKLVPDAFSDRYGRACTDAVAAAYTDGKLSGPELTTVLKLGAPCDRVRVNSRSHGAPCERPSECDRAEGYDCVHKANSRYGSCQVPEEAGPGRDCRAARVTCVPGFYCDGEHCVEVAAPGGQCTIHEQCGDAGYCGADSRCAARKGVRAPCKDDVECIAGICDEFTNERVCWDRIVLSRAEPICNNLK